MKEERKEEGRNERSKDKERKEVMKVK